MSVIVDSQYIMILSMSIILLTTEPTRDLYVFVVILLLMATSSSSSTCFPSLRTTPASHMAETIPEDRVKAALAATYKQQKEAFVSNLNGSSLWEINNVTLVAPVCPNIQHQHKQQYLIDASRRSRCYYGQYSRLGSHYFIPTRLWRH